MLSAAISAALAEQGWCIVPDYLNAAEIAALRDECLGAHTDGAFHHAGIGSGTAEIRSDIRSDQVYWIDEAQISPALEAVLARLEALRLTVNRELFLGLFDIELHFAVYPPGGGYRRHLDRFRDDNRRTLTIIIYLNKQWTPADGGLLRFWPEESGHPIEIVPTGGKLVAFLSDRFWHEVTPARQQRVSLTGWFRRR